MPIDITMPALSPTMETGTLAKWLVKVGDAVKSGDILAEIETDKATMEVESIDEGTVAELLFADGSDAIPVGTVIARLSGEGETAAPAPKAEASAGSAPKAEAPAEALSRASSPEGKAAAPEPAPAPPSSSGEGDHRSSAMVEGADQGKAQPVKAPSTTPETARSPSPEAGGGSVDGGSRLNASPLARRLAEAKGMDLAALKGSGPNGRIVKADIDGAQPGAAQSATQPAAGQGTAAQSPDAMANNTAIGIAQPGDTQFRDGQSGVTRPNASKPAAGDQAPATGSSPAAPPASPAPASPAASASSPALARPAPARPAPASAAPSLPPPEGVPMEAIKLSNMRRTIARRLAESKATVPHFYLTVDVRLDALLKLRGELNTSLEASGVKLSVNDLLIKALGLALTQVPDANVQFAGDTLYRFGRADVSVAVAIPGGLITPVITDAANKRLSVIASEMKDLAARAKDGKLKPEEYQGGTASISNLGMFGIKQFDAVINPPQGLILAVGAGEKRPYVVDGALAVATVLSATGSFDHRAIDGAVGAQLMSAFKGLIESPMGMLA